MSPAPDLPRPSTEQLRLLQEAAYLALMLAQRLQDNFAGHAASSGLTAGQAKVVMALRPGHPVSQRALANDLDYDPSNLTGLIDKLEARGAVRRTPDERDRRVKMLILTEAGTQIRETFWADLTSDPGPLAHLADDQAAALRDRLAEALDAELPAPSSADKQT